MLRPAKNENPVVKAREKWKFHVPLRKKCPKHESVGRRLKFARKSRCLRLSILGFLPAFRCIRQEMGLVFVQHTADHTFIDQDRFRRSRGRENQFSTWICFSFRYSRMDTTRGCVDK